MRRGNSGMGEIVMDKDELKAILVRNRDAHMAAFESAVVTYRERAIEKLDGIITELRAGKMPNLWIALPVPEQHMEDYERAIRMVDHHLYTTLVLNETAYAQLVDDDWGWKDSFTSNTMAYNSPA